MKVIPRLIGGAAGIILVIMVLDILFLTWISDAISWNWLGSSLGVLAGLYLRYTIITKLDLLSKEIRHDAGDPCQP